MYFFSNYSSTTDGNNKAEQVMVEACKKLYKNGAEQLQRIKQFERQCTFDQAVEIYTDESFMYKIINRALRKLLSFNGFLSTSVNSTVAIKFAKRKSTLSVPVLFEIVINYYYSRLSTRAYADISQISKFKIEQEILFDIGNVFRIDRSAFDQHLSIWKLRLILRSTNEQSLQQFVEHVRNEVGQTNPITMFGELLRRMGEYNKAESHYLRLLSDSSASCDDRPALLNGIGLVYSDKGLHHNSKAPIHSNSPDPIVF
ncbi:unnamed protein product [Didymodactylos carnosus]|uniref:ADP ribosyltransferase domain-containing protein n=1 Tax=Didymodactylos carnosus TaxID=1234261 RepID=A0A8S2JH07_9BILA|nr:unnamed protein product [Didymodactylos carnosus]CAF3810656.1 unnamed protein product [Didymodactylos carnosus]